MAVKKAGAERRGSGAIRYVVNGGGRTDGQTLTGRLNCALGHAARRRADRRFSLTFGKIPDFSRVFACFVGFFRYFSHFVSLRS